MLKKISIIALFFLLFNANISKADICVDVDERVAKKALAEIEKYEEVTSYCSLCAEAKPSILKAKDAKIVKIDKNIFSLMIDGQVQDLAYLYIDKTKSYKNLAFIAGCSEVKKHSIPQTMVIFVEKKKQTSDEIWQKSHKMAKEIVKICEQKATRNNPQTTADVRVAEIKLNDCITSAIKKEIRQAFPADKQKEMYDIVLNTRKSISSFYWKIYNENKYCEPTCGTMAQVIYLSQESKVLEDMLTRAIFLNINKNGY